MLYSLEAPRRGTSNEYPQRMFLWRIKKKKKKKNFLIEKKKKKKKKTSYQELWY